jgi:hypothetical protein
MISLESLDQGSKISQRRRNPTQIDKTGVSEELAGSRQGAALTGQLIVISLVSKLDANAAAP